MGLLSIETGSKALGDYLFLATTIIRLSALSAILSTPSL